MTPISRADAEALIRLSPAKAPEDRLCYRRKSIVVVLASWNEEGKVGRAVSRVPSDVVDQVVVVDNGSTDRTAEEAELAGALVIRHPWNAGAGGGYRSGYWFGLLNDYDLIVEIAGDNQDDPRDISRAVDVLIDGQFDYVQGSRWIEGGVAINMTASRKVATKVYSRILTWLFGQVVTDATNGFRVFRRDLLEDERIALWQDWLAGYELEPYLLIKAITCSYRYGEAPVTKTYHSTMADNTKMVPLKDWYAILRPLFLLKLGLRS